MRKHAYLLCLLALATVSPSSSFASLLYLFESDANAAPGVEVFIQSFDSLTDLLNQNPASGTFTPIDVSGNFSIHGLAHDGNQFHMLFESDANAAPGAEVFIQSFDSLTDLLTQMPASGAFTPIDVSGNFSIGGLAHDGNQFHMLFESNANAAPGAEVFIQSFDSLIDLLTQMPASGAFTPIDVSGNFSIHGFAGIKELGNTQVPEPTTLGLLALGLAGLLSCLRKAARRGDLETQFAGSHKRA